MEPLDGRDRGTLSGHREDRRRDINAAGLMNKNRVTRTYFT